MEDILGQTIALYGQHTLTKAISVEAVVRLVDGVSNVGNHYAFFFSMSSNESSVNYNNKSLN